MLPSDVCVSSSVYIIRKSLDTDHTQLKKHITCAHPSAHSTHRRASRLQNMRVYVCASNTKLILCVARNITHPLHCVVLCTFKHFQESHMQPGGREHWHLYTP